MPLRISTLINRQLRLQPKEIFNSEVSKQHLARKSVRGGVTTMTGQGIMFLLHMGRNVVLARLLTPQDFGIVGMVMVIISLADVLKGASLSMATVQKKEITEEQISTLFWINVLISVALGLLIALSAPFISQFYERKELTAVTIALSMSFIINGLAIQHKALLLRNLKYSSLAIEKIVPYSLGLVVAIIMAKQGLGYWALVGSTISISVFNVLMVFYFCPWIPGKIRKGTGAGNMLKFGGYVTGYNFVNYFSRNTDNVLIGKFIGAAALGLYAKAYQLFMLPLTQIRNPINSMALPILSKISYDSKHTLR